MGAGWWRYTQERLLEINTLWTKYSIYLHKEEKHLDMLYMT